MRGPHWMFVLAAAFALAVPLEIQYGALLCWQLFTGAMAVLCLAIFAGMNQRPVVMVMFFALAGALMVLTVYAVPSTPSRLVLVTAFGR